MKLLALVSFVFSFVNAFGFFSLHVFSSFVYGLLFKATRIKESKKKLGAILTRREQQLINFATPAFLTIWKALCSTSAKHVNFYFPRNFDLNKLIEYHHSYFFPQHAFLSDIIPTNNQN